MTTLEVPEQTTRQASDFQRYYEEAGPDYATWSPNFNMHFGFFRWGMNPLRREAMLEQMNEEVMHRLHLTPDSCARVFDLGCGLGATLRSLARLLPQAELSGITLVPWQLENGRRLNESTPDAARITLVLGNYERTAQPTQSFDGVYAIESSCYARGANKSAFLKEAHRLLHPGGRIVIADGFLGPSKLRGPQKSLYRRLCECWVIDELGQVDEVATGLKGLGFDNINVERIQSRVTPSVLHVPWVTAKFLLTQVLFGKRKMTRARWNNIVAPLLMPFISYPFGPMAYYLISATRV
jgi:MPBQ/MSBQ methyltransferase